MRSILIALFFSLFSMASLAHADTAVSSSQAPNASQSINVSSADNPAVANKLIPTLNKMASELATLRKETSRFQMQSSDDLTSISSQIDTLRSQIDDTEKTLALGAGDSAVKSKVISALAANRISGGAAMAASQPTYLSHLESLAGHVTRLQWLVLFSLLLALSLLVTVTKMIKSNRQRISGSKPVSEDDEFDFLNSEEGMVAKLDLARAYLAMQDFNQMRDVLNDVITHGNEDQATQARALLKEAESC